MQVLPAGAARYLNHVATVWPIRFPEPYVVGAKLVAAPVVVGRDVDQCPRVARQFVIRVEADGDARGGQDSSRGRGSDRLVIRWWRRDLASDFVPVGPDAEPERYTGLATGSCGVLQFGEPRTLDVETEIRPVSRRQMQDDDLRRYAGAVNGGSQGGDGAGRDVNF